MNLRDFFTLDCGETSDGKAVEVKHLPPIGHLEFVTLLTRLGNCNVRAARAADDTSQSCQAVEVQLHVECLESSICIVFTMSLTAACL